MSEPLERIGRDPFKITGPTCISFSGGRTSAFMLWRVLQAHQMSLPPKCVVCFANTGKEAPETLRFVQDCSEQWGVPIHWLEFVSRSGEKFRVVDFATASRNSEPFDALIAEKKFLPNVAMRFCTEELKVKPIKMFSGMYDDETMIGVRADEQHRIPKMRARGLLIPLADAGIGKATIREFWRSQPFDLALVEVDGVTPDGNCDNCFLKGLGTIIKNAQRKPQGIVWWARKEKQTGGTFAKDRPSYSAIAEFSAAQADAFGHDNQDAIPCFCGD